VSQAIHHGASADQARTVCVFVHGRGQTPEQMVETVLPRLDAAGVSFRLPRSPGGAWYDARAIDPLDGQTSAQVSKALDIIADEMERARRDCPGMPVVLAGFSQGACLTVEYLMRGGRADAAAILTGCRVGGEEDDLPRAALGGMPVYASCGDDDPWIPLPAFQRALGDIAASGARLRADIIPGRGHEVDAEECEEFSRLMAAVAASGRALERTQ